MRWGENYGSIPIDLVVSLRIRIKKKILILWIRPAAVVEIRLRGHNHHQESVVSLSWGNLSCRPSISLYCHAVVTTLYCRVSSLTISDILMYCNTIILYAGRILFRSWTILFESSAIIAHAFLRVDSCVWYIISVQSPAQSALHVCSWHDRTICMIEIEMLVSIFSFNPFEIYWSDKRIMFAC